MVDTRRCFLKNLAGVSSSFLIFQSSPPIPTLRHKTPVDPQRPPKRRTRIPWTHPETRSAHNCKPKKKSFAKPWPSFSPKRDLKLQVDALHPSDVFSVAVFKRTQEIEKLAKQLKNYAKP